MRDDMLLKITRSDPWYVNIVNFMVAGYVPLGENKRKLIWDSPYLFRVCADGLLRRCVQAEEDIHIIERCQSSPYGGHYGVFHTHAKIWQSGFFWPTVYEDKRFHQEMWSVLEAREYKFTRSHATHQQPSD
jgi:hypothetical protein